MKRAPVVILMLFLFGASLRAQEARFAVAVSFPNSLSQPSMTEQVQSFVSRELRSLNDVAIVSQNAAYFISVVAEQLKLDNGHVAGVALSYVMHDLATDRLLHEMGVDRPDRLQAMCQRMVARFDVVFLEPR